MTVQPNLHCQSDTTTLSCERVFFTKHQRLLKPSEFQNVFNDAPFRASNPQILILACPSSSNTARLGLVIAKKHVKRAVDRNRIKRVARETFRLQQHKLPPIDAIVLARRGAHTLSTEELGSIFNGLWRRVRKRAQSVLNQESVEQ